MTTVSEEELERLYALEEKVREVLDKSQAFISCWEFYTYDTSIDGMEIRKEIEELIDKGNGHAIRGRGRRPTCGEPVCC